MAKIPNEKKKKKNVRLLCAIADVSTKCCCHSLKEKPKEAEDARLVEEIRELQQIHFYSLGYRKAAAMLSALHNRETSAKRVRRLMRERDLLSRVRRKKFSEEVYATRSDSFKRTRRAVRKMKMPDLVSRQFFSSLPRRVCAWIAQRVALLSATKLLASLPACQRAALRVRAGHNLSALP